MADNWKQLKHFSDDDDFRAYLTGDLKLPNADAIIQKLTLGPVQGGIEFAKGTRRLRYAEGAFYLEACAAPAAPVADLGVGKHINIKSLEERWQHMAPNIKVTAKLDAHMEVAISYREYEEKGVCGIHVRLNPTKLKGPKQVEERVRWIDNEIKG